MESPRSPYGHDDGSLDPHAYGAYTLAPARAEPRVNESRLWSGGLVTAAVAALTALVAVLLVRGVLGIAIFAPERDGAMGNASTGLLAAGAAGAALVATAVLRLLMAATPQPGRFFVWIMTLATAAMVLLVFTTSASLESRIGTAGVYIVIGVTIGSLLTAVGRGSRS